MHSSGLASSPTVERHETKRALTAGYFAAFVALGFVAASLGPTLPDLAAQTGTDLGGVSYLFTTRSLGYLIGSFLSGRAYDRTPGHPVFAASLVAMALFIGLATLVPQLWLLTCVLLLVGIAEGFMDVGGNTLLVWLHRDRVGPLINGLHFCFGFGAFLSPLAVALVVATTGWYGWAYWASALLLLPLAVVFARLSSPVAPSIVDAADGQGQTNWRLVGLLSLFFLLYVAAEVSFGGWVFTYAVRLGLYDETTAAYLVSAFWGAITAGRLLAIPLAARLRPRTILWGDLLLCIASVGAIMLLPQSRPVLWAGSIGLGLGMASMFPTALAFAQRRMALNGQITSIFLVGSSLGAMSLPWLVGQLFERSGPGVTMPLVLAALLLECAVFIAVLRAAPTPARRDPNNN